MPPIPIRQPLQDVLEKLDQLIAEGEEIRSNYIPAWHDLSEFRSKAKVWKEYTCQVLEMLFASEQQEHDFRVQTEVFRRSSGSVADFSRDEKQAILEGITYLRVLQRNLPIAGKVETEIDREAANPAVADSGPEPVASLLANISTELANSYRQVRRDLQDVSRLSYRGTANELREILREVLHQLAPDAAVMATDWFMCESREPDSRPRPTHQQRARYILEKKDRSSRVGEVVNRTLTTVDEGLSSLVRDMYSRVSAAAHSSQDVEEIKKQLRYFDALMHDLC